jgi:hypothetical protein
MNYIGCLYFMKYIYDAVIATAMQLLVILGPGLLLALIMNFVNYSQYNHRPDNPPVFKN